MKMLQERALAERAEKVKALRIKARSIHEIFAKSDKSIDEIKNFCNSISQEIDRIFYEKRLKTNTKDLGIIVNTGAEDSDKLVKDVLAVVEDENVTNSVELFSGLANVIDVIVRMRNQKSKFSDIAEEIGNAIATDAKKENK